MSMEKARNAPIEFGCRLGKLIGLVLTGISFDIPWTIEPLATGVSQAGKSVCWVYLISSPLTSFTFGIPSTTKLESSLFY